MYKIFMSAYISSNKRDKELFREKLGGDEKPLEQLCVLGAVFNMTKFPWERLGVKEKNLPSNQEIDKGNGELRALWPSL